MRVSPRQLSGGFKEVREDLNDYNIRDIKQCGFCFFLLSWRLCGFHFLNGFKLPHHLGVDAGGNAEVGDLEGKKASNWGFLNMPELGE